MFSQDLKSKKKKKIEKKIEKKIQIGRLKKTHFAKRSILNIFLPNWVGWVLGLVEMIYAKEIDLAQSMWSWGCPT